MTEPNNLEDRVSRLEDVAFEGDGLTRAVTRLGLNANALGEALLTVDRNQQQLTKLGKELHELDEKSATTQDILHVREERRRSLLRFLAGMALFVPIAAYVAINVHEVYRDTCDAGLQQPPGWCDDVFLFDEQGTNEIQQVVTQITDAGREGCVAGNRRVEQQAAILRAIASAEPNDPQSTSIMQSAQQLLDTRRDCLAAYPETDIDVHVHN